MSEVHVFGASAAVGGFLLPRLAAEGHSVVAYSRKPVHPMTGQSGVSWSVLDLWREQSLSSATTIVSAGPLNGLVDWLNRAQTPVLTRLIALGSMSIEAKVDSADPAERAIARRLRLAEQGLQQICARRDIALTLLRPTLIWGAGHDLSLNTLYRFGRRWHLVPMPLEPGGLRQPVHADDVAAACVRALHSPSSAGCTLAVGGAERLANGAMWSRVIRTAQARPVALPNSVLAALSHLLGARGGNLRASLGRWHCDQLADNEPAMRMLDWQPRGFAPQSEDFR